VIGVVTRASAIRERPEVVDDMHAAGLGVMVYTLNSTDTWAEARELGVDGIITDKPSRLDEWLAETAPGT
jgi:glycerophosphoryl diester phosphodiesterase